MNKKGQQIFAGIGIFVMVFIVMVQFIEPIKDQIEIARDVSALDCTNSSITTGVKASCVVIDWTLPYFVWIVLAAGIGIIGSFAARKFIKPS